MISAGSFVPAPGTRPFQYNPRSSSGLGEHALLTATRFTVCFNEPWPNSDHAHTNSTVIIVARAAMTNNFILGLPCAQWMTKSRLFNLLSSSLFSYNTLLRRFNKQQPTNDNPTTNEVPIAKPRPKASHLLTPERCSLPGLSEGVGCSTDDSQSALFSLRCGTDRRTVTREGVMGSQSIRLHCSRRS